MSLLIDHDLEIYLTKEGEGRRTFEANFGRLGRVQVLDIHATAITEDEKVKIRTARQSYEKLWGGRRLKERITEDPFDGWPLPHWGYDTTHQIAQITFPDGTERLLTNRKVGIRSEVSKVPQLWDDLAFWNIEGEGEVLSLWEAFQKGTNRFIPLDSIHQIAAISRTGTYPYDVGRKSEQHHEGGAVAWAMMQYAASLQDNHRVWICMLGPVMRDIIMTIRDPKKNIRTKLDFTPTEQTLSLDSTQRVRLNRSSPDVQKHVIDYPMYWQDSDQLNHTLLEAVKSHLIVGCDLAESCRSLLASEDLKLVEDPTLIARVIQNHASEVDLENIINLFTISHSALGKHLIPLFDQRTDIRQRIIDTFKQKPYSSTLIPADWHQSAKNLIRAAKKKYQ